MSSHKSLAFIAAAGAIITAAYGCRDATQVTLQITTANISCGALMGVRITVAGSRTDAEGRANGDFVTATATCASPASSDVGTLVITPGSSGNAAVIVVAGIRESARSCNEANKYKGCVVARRSLSFRDHVSSTMPIVIEPACVDVPCDVATTCKKGTCITSEVDCGDDGACVSKDPRGREDGDGGAQPDASMDAVAPDGATLDGANPDATVDAAADTGGDAAIEPVPLFSNCRVTCFGPPPETNCMPVSPCCHTAGGPGGGPSPQTVCRPAMACLHPLAGTRAGIVACCRQQVDCGASQVCCFTPTTGDGIDEPHGYAVCRPAAECVGPRMLACLGAIDCMGAGKMCEPYPNPMTSAYGAAFGTCQ